MAKNKFGEPRKKYEGEQSQITDVIAFCVGIGLDNVLNMKSDVTE